MYTTLSSLIVPVRVTPLEALSLSDTHDKLNVYSGTQAMEQYGITVSGSGAKAKGRISGELQTYDYNALYNVYQVPNSKSANYWFVKYSEDSSNGELKKTFESSKVLTTKYDVEFEIWGNDFGVSSVFITFQVIRLTMNGETKDYVVSNPASTGATNADGEPYRGQFKPIGAEA